MDHRVDVAPLELDAVGVLLGDQAVLVALEGQGDGAAGRDDVEAVLVAEVVGVLEGVDVAHQVHRAEGGGRLVLGAMGVVRVRVARVVLDLAIDFVGGV